MNKKLTLPIVAVGLLAVIFGINQYHKPTMKTPEQTSCTMEALMCPDGSAVGRSGPSCAFTACPNQPWIEGTLKQGPGGFALILPAPTSTGEVDYRMPLLLKVTNVIGELVNQKVRAYGTFTEGATFAVDHLEELPGDAGNPTLGEIAVGQTKFVNGVRITLNSIVEDSRCPIDVQCIRAGTVTVNVTLQSDTDKETRDIINTETVPFDSFQVSVANVKPSRSSEVAPQSENYLITFRVQQN